MDLMRIGTLGAYMKNMEKAIMWQLKQESGDLTSHKKSLDEWLEQTAWKVDSASSLGGAGSEKDKDSMEVQMIYYKVQNGKSLTAEEKEYLRANDPEVYARAISIEQEKKAYAQDLKRCKTREDVQRLKLSKVAGSMSTLSGIINNPTIPLEKKLQYAMLENAKVRGIVAETTKFIRSGEYDKLPTEAEYQEAMKSIREENHSLEHSEEIVEELQRPEGARETTASGAEKVLDTAAENAFDQLLGQFLSETVTSLQPGQDDEKNGLEAEDERKTKRANAKAARAPMGSEGVDAAILAEEIVSFSRSI